MSCFTKTIISAIWYILSLILKYYEPNIVISPFKSLIFSSKSENLLVSNFKLQFFKNLVQLMNAAVLN
jgi:hypothetical protein